MSRKTFYIRKEDKWLYGAIQALLKEADGIGVRATESEVVVAALKEYLSKYKNVAGVKTEKKPQVTGNKRTFMCPTQYTNLLDRVDDLVRIKRLGGTSTSFSYELAKLALAGLTGATEYGKIQRELLNSFKGP